MPGENLNNTKDDGLTPRAVSEISEQRIANLERALERLHHKSGDSNDPEKGPSVGTAIDKATKMAQKMLLVNALALVLGPAGLLFGMALFMGYHAAKKAKEGTGNNKSMRSEFKEFMQELQQLKEDLENSIAASQEQQYDAGQGQELGDTLTIEEKNAARVRLENEIEDGLEKGEITEDQAEGLRKVNEVLLANGLTHEQATKEQLDDAQETVENEPDLPWADEDIDAALQNAGERQELGLETEKGEKASRGAEQDSGIDTVAPTTDDEEDREMGVVPEENLGGSADHDIDNSSLYSEHDNAMVDAPNWLDELETDTGIEEVQDASELELYNGIDTLERARDGVEIKNGSTPDDSKSSLGELAERDVNIWSSEEEQGSELGPDAERASNMGGASEEKSGSELASSSVWTLTEESSNTPASLKRGQPFDQSSSVSGESSRSQASAAPSKFGDLSALATDRSKKANKARASLAEHSKNATQGRSLSPGKQPKAPSI